MAFLDKILSATVNFLKGKKKKTKRQTRTKKKSKRADKKKKRLPAKKKTVKSVPKTKHIKKKKVKPTNKASVHGRQEELVGEITHYFSRIQVVVIKIKRGKIKIGDQLHIRGRSTDFTQKVKSLQIESVDVKEVKKGQVAGLKIAKQAKEGDKVYLRGA